MLRLGHRPLIELRDLVFPYCQPGFQDDLCAHVLNVAVNAVVTALHDEKLQLLSILQFANAQAKIGDVIQHCRGWTPGLASTIDALLARLGSPAERVLPGSVAFLDRTELRNHLEEILDPASGARIVLIKGPTPSGKSHSFSLIGRVGKNLAGANMLCLKLDEYATDETLEPIDLVRSIIWKLAIPAVEMPTGKRAQDNRIVLKLVDWFVGAFNTRRNSGTPVWLVLDGFHLTGCPQWLENFAIQLAVQCATQQLEELNLFLIGFNDIRNKLPSECDGAVRVEETSLFNREHVWVIVQDYAKTLSFTIPPESKDTILDAIFKDISPRTQPLTLPWSPDHFQMKVIAHRVIDMVNKTLSNTLAATAAVGGTGT